MENAENRIGVDDERGYRNFFITDNEIIDRYRLGPYGFTLYSILLRFSSKEGISFPSIATIADRGGMSERKVREELQRLVELNLVSITYRKIANGDNATNLYTLLPVLKARQRADLLHEVPPHQEEGVPTVGREVPTVGRESTSPRAARTRPIEQDLSEQEEGSARLRKRATKPKAEVPSVIETIRKILLRYPPKDLWETLTRQLEGKTEEQIRSAYEAWRMRGYSPTNYGWIEWVISGIPQQGQSKKPTNKNPSTYEILQDMIAEERTKNGKQRRDHDDADTFDVELPGFQ